MSFLNANKHRIGASTESSKQASKDIQHEHKDTDTELQKIIRNNMKVKEETRKIKDQIALLKQGKSVELFKGEDDDAKDELLKK